MRDPLAGESHERERVAPADDAVPSVEADVSTRQLEKRCDLFRALDVRGGMGVEAARTPRAAARSTASCTRSAARVRSSPRRDVARAPPAARRRPAGARFVGGEDDRAAAPVAASISIVASRNARSSRKPSSLAICRGANAPTRASP